MSHYAKVFEGKVVQVIVAEEDFFTTFVDTSPGIWIQTSYNTMFGVHWGPDGNPDDGVPLRGNFAGVGYIYDAENDVFYPPKPFESAVISGPDWVWQAPPKPNDGKNYTWDDTIKNWVEV